MPRRQGPDLEALARGLEPKLRRAVLGALSSLTDKASIQKIADMIKDGNVEGVLQALGLSVPDEVFGALHQSLTDIVAAGAAKTAEAAAMRVAFDLLNPKTVDFIRNYELNLIREINRNTREGVRAVLTDGLVAGRNPRQTAVAIRQHVGLTERQVKAVLRFRQELETFHLKQSAGGWNLGARISRAPGGAQVFAVDADGNPLDGIFQRRLRDFRYDSVLQRAMKTGKPLSPEQIDRMVLAYQRKYLRHRSEMIARTESLRAVNIGAQSMWQQAVASGALDGDVVRRKWLTAHDERTCPVCSPIPKLNPAGVAMDEPFKTPNGPANLPPIHPACRCTLIYRAVPPGFDW